MFLLQRTEGIPISSASLMNMLCAYALSIPVVNIHRTTRSHLPSISILENIPVLADTYPFNSLPIPYRKRDSDLLNRKQLDAI